MARPRRAFISSKRRHRGSRGSSKGDSSGNNNSNTAKRERQNPRKLETEKDDIAAVQEENVSDLKDSKKTRMRRQLDSLHKEVEIAQYGRSERGQIRRKLPKNQTKARTRKRRLLEVQDNEQLAVEAPEHNRSRLRGSKIAQEDTVIHGSLIFGNKQPSEESDEYDNEVEEDSEYELSDDELEEGDDDEEAEDNGDYMSLDEVDEVDQMEDEDDGGVEVFLEVDGEYEEIVQGDDPPKRGGGGRPRKKTGAVKKKITRTKFPKKRKMFRLRSFKSQKMARLHGEALSLWGKSGQGKEVIEKLKQVAHEAPLAPQVYSSLGMVYEDLLRDCQNKSFTTSDVVNAVKITNDNSEDEKDKTEKDDDIPDETLRRKLALAKKAYGGYHVAAFLCKKDFSLWIRAADSAAEIAELYTAAMLHPMVSTEPEHVESFRSEKRHWLTEAKNDYQTADNLQPPGINVPAKLAHVLIELGNLSEALTLLTDLKNRKSFSKDQRSEFEMSFKSWLLYSDLMLRIGYECKQWNCGNQANKNYMFRRWLRKHSATFDWEERRIQALTKALEAAAGTKSCSNLINWLLVRASGDYNHSSTERNLARVNEKSMLGELNDSSLSKGTDNPSEDASISENLDSESITIRGNKSLELEKSDKSPKLGSTVTSERGNSVVEEIESHEDEYAEPIFPSNEQAAPSALVEGIALDEDVKENVTETAIPPLPLSASCKTVCAIASELMRQMMAKKLYKGSKLVGEAVSLYLKERATIIENREEALRARNNQMESTSVFGLRQKAYDMIDEDTSDSEESLGALSDEDLYESRFSLALRQGILPPELKFLYGLALFAVGGMKFVASKCLESIDDLELERRSWWDSDKTIDTSVTADNRWLFFHHTMTEPLNRTEAYALVADVLRINGQEKELSSFVSTLFSGHVELLNREGELDNLFEGVYFLHNFANQKRQQILRVLVASARYKMNYAESLMSHSDGVKAAEGQKLGIELMDALSRLLSLVWKVEPDGSVSSTCVELFDAFTRTFSSLSMLPFAQAGGGDKMTRQELLGKVLKPLSMLCGGANLDLSGHETMPDVELTDSPFSDSWLSSAQRSLALRAYNLCVATNVSLFSGWEDDEFVLRLVRYRNALHSHYFGVSLTDGLVSGLVLSSERELEQQWDLLRTILPDNFSFNFSAQLSALREIPWYKEKIEKINIAKSSHEIACYGEEDGLLLLLRISRVCLDLARNSDEKNLKNTLIHTSLSVLLPISQFCLNQRIWDSSIGRAAATRTGAEEWRHFEEGKNDIPAPSQRPDYIRPNKRFLHAKPIDNLGDWFGGENGRDPLSNLINISTNELQAAWLCPTSVSMTTESNSTMTAVVAMHRVDTCMHQLRACYTEEAVEKMSLQLSATLVELAGCPDCRNPFIALHHAASFASQAGKRGTCDQYFKAPLPRGQNCSATEALVILGRAECLLAVCFCPEAAFLCSYVASVCSLHRDQQRDDLEWNEQWKIVGILAYNVSVLIRYAASSIIRENNTSENVGDWTWQCNVIEELKHGRADGLSLQASFVSGRERYQDSNSIGRIADAPQVMGASGRYDESVDMETKEVASDGRTNLDVVGVAKLTADISVHDDQLGSIDATEMIENTTEVFEV